MGRMIHAGQKSPGRDVRDRLILALYAQLKAERETREALEYVIRHGAVSAEVLEAIASDPVPVAEGSDIAAVEQVIAFDKNKRARQPTPPPEAARGAVSHTHKVSP